MEKTEHINNCDINFSAYRQNERVFLFVEVKNTTDEVITGKTAMGAWCGIKLKDENDRNRLASVLETAAVTHWEIKPEEPLFMGRKTNKPSELPDEELPVEFTQYSNEAKNDEDIYYSPNIALPQEEDDTFTAEAYIKIDCIETIIELSFKPSELTKIPEEIVTEYNITEEN